MSLMPLNTYVILELKRTETVLDAGEDDIKDAEQGIVVYVPDQFTDVEVGDVINFVWNAGHGQIRRYDGKELVHVKHEHLLSKEL